MTTEAENPPAFPAAITCTAAGDVYHGLPGMSLRDWFAGQALAGRMARNSNYASWADAATDAYEAADAMLSARHPTQEQG